MAASDSSWAFHEWAPLRMAPLRWECLTCNSEWCKVITRQMRHVQQKPVFPDLCHCHTKIIPHQSFFWYDSDYRIVPYCVHKLYFIIIVIPKGGLEVSASEALFWYDDKDLKDTILAMYETKNGKIRNLWTFWPVIQLINSLMKIWLWPICPTVH